MSDILTVREVSDYLRLSRTTVWRWCNEGKLPAFKVGRNWRIQREVLERLSRPDLNTAADPTPAEWVEGGGSGGSAGDR